MSWKKEVVGHKLFAGLVVCLLLSPGLPAQSDAAPHVSITQAAKETPAALAERKRGLQEMLQGLSTTGRIMQVVAHPDDEDGAMLTLESRVHGNTAELFTFTRGEGGQNAQGAVFFDELGILRTLELLAADKEYGAEERFSHLADFGFSKTAEETYQKWGGRDVPLKDLVRAVREFQPDVLVARFSGTPKDGHGHHQASAQLTMQAFTDAADGKRFVDTGRPWRVTKLYTGLAGDQATLVPDETQPSALLGGKTPQEVAIAGLRHQESQGAGNWKGPIPKVYSSYKILESQNGKLGTESDFFDGLDLSLPGLAIRFHRPDARAALEQAAQAIAEARTKAEVSPDAAVEGLVRASNTLAGLRSGDSIEGPFETRLREKQQQLQQAIALAEGLQVRLTQAGATDGAFIVPGQTLPLQLQIENRGARSVDFPVNGRARFNGLPQGLPGGSLATIDFLYTVPRQQPATRAPFHRESPVTDSSYLLTDATAFAREALPRLPVFETLTWSVDGVTGSTTATVPLFVAPPVSVSVHPTQEILRTGFKSGAALQVNLQNITKEPIRGEVKIDLPRGWQSDPASQTLTIQAKAVQSVRFEVRPPATSKPALENISIRFDTAGRTYTEGYELLARSDLPDAFPYYAPARARISLIDAEIPDKHKIGYVMGAGDTVPDSLASLGFDVHLLTEQDLAAGDLAQYDTIVTGVRAYGSRGDLRAQNARLLDYVRKGGTMVVQYEQDVDGFNAGKYTPYPATMGRQWVSQEEQPVTLLDPESQIFRYPNRITARDFNGWVQERGLYFMKEWSPDYAPLLSMSDAGEPALQGGLLVAHYGKGTYITTALSFYRELPNGVPGAARLFINLLAAGHNPADQPVTNAGR